MNIPAHLILKWAHIIALVYWLGGEWGVFQTAYNVTNPRLPLEERRRHMETAYRIDILARSGIILLFPLGFHMGYDMGVHAYGDWVAPVWCIALAWLTLTWTAFLTRETDLGLRLTRWDERLRYALIPLLFALAVKSLLTGAPFNARWYAAKVLIFSLLLVIGLGLRFVMRHWTLIFRELAANGPTSALEARLRREVNMARGMAYVYWVGIGSVAFLGVTKPF